MKQIEKEHPICNYYFIKKRRLHLLSEVKCVNPCRIFGRLSKLLNQSSFEHVC
jgi:hypothetical protein